jgi:DNA invertase Pin-like site-specific DNA recombinase
VSRLTDESTSPERQLATIERYVSEHPGHELVGQAVDLDVSGYKVSPFRRPALGDWLGNRSSEMDLICWSRLDRAVRSMRDMSDLVGWAKDHSKVLAFVSGTAGSLVLDMTSPVSELIALVMSFAAQMEAQAIQERTLDSRKRLRELARWGGGWVPCLGYRPVQMPAGGYRLEVDPVYGPLIVRIADLIIGGTSASAVARLLNSEGVPVSREVSRARTGVALRGGSWHGSNVSKMMRSQNLRGITTYREYVVRGDDGMPLHFAEPLIDEVKFRQLQQALDDASHPTTASVPALLAGVAYCGVCKARLYPTRSAGYGYYRCSDRVRGIGACTSLSATMTVLDATATESFLKQVGGIEIRRKVTVPGDDHAEAAANVGRQITSLVSDRYVGGQDVPGYDSMLSSLQAEFDRLKALPDEPDTEVDEGTGELFRDRWEREDTGGRRRLMAQAGFRITFSKTKTGELTGTRIDPGLAARAGLAARGETVTVPEGLEEGPLTIRARGPAAVTSAPEGEELPLHEIRVMPPSRG